MSSGRLISTPQPRRGKSSPAAWADFVHGMRPWAWFTTLTFRPSVVPSVMLGGSVADASCSEWLGNVIGDYHFMAGPDRGPVSFVALERHKTGYPHLHILTRFHQDMLFRKERYAVMERWNKSYGFARIFMVRGDGFEVAAYCAKYISKNGAVWFDDGMRRRAGPPPVKRKRPYLLQPVVRASAR